MRVATTELRRLRPGVGIDRWPPACVASKFWRLPASNNTSNAGTAASGGAIYGLGIFGAWVFFWQQADSFWEYVWAVVQGILWPAFMVYEVFKNLAS